MRIIACCATDTGTSRKINQDAVSIKKRRINGEDCHMAIVCDGVGGLARGEYASCCMRERLEQWFLYEYPQIAGCGDADSIIKQRLRKAVELQNRILYEYGQRQGIRCATTVSAMLLAEQKYYIVHVGDSRVYLLKERAERLMQDQTLVAHEIKQGHLTEAEAQSDVRQHVLLQSIGADRQTDILLYSGTSDGDCTFLLCSDGFYHRIAEPELLETFCKQEYRDSRQLGSKMEELFRLLKERGERDNISAAVLLQREER